MTTSFQTVLVVDDDPMICDALAAGLESPGRHLIVCRDLEAARMMLELNLVTHVISDVKFSGPFRFEGLDVLDAVRRAPNPPPVLLMSGYTSVELKAEAGARGAAALLDKPVPLSEIESFLGQPKLNREGIVTIVPTLDDILQKGLLYTEFQPLVWLDRPINVIGFEALTRLKNDSPLANPEILFRYAAAKGRLEELEMAAAASAILAGKELTTVGFLGINVHPMMFADIDQLCDGILDAAAEAAVSPMRLVLEITEQGPLPDLAKVEAAAATLRTHGIRFAFDDVGSAYSHLNFIAAVRPSYLKISQQFGTGCESNELHRKIIENIQSLARSFDCEVLLEGIETARTAAFARETGIRLGQGYLYSRPTDAASLLAKYGG